MQIFIEKENRLLANRNEIKNIPKKYLSRLKIKECVHLMALLIQKPGMDKLKIKEFKKSGIKIFLRKNKNEYFNIPSKEYKENKEEDFYITQNILKTLYDDLYKELENITSTLKETVSDEESYTEETYEVDEYTTFLDIRKKLSNEDVSVNFTYNFDKCKKQVDYLKDVDTTQILKIYINTQGEYFDYTIINTYVCPECGEVTKKPEHEVLSTNNKIKCPGMIDNYNKNGELVQKACLTVLQPDVSRNNTKMTYVYACSAHMEDGTEIKTSAISFKKLPRGPLTVAAHKINTSHGMPFVHIADFKKEKKLQYELPEKEDAHYIFSLIDSIDDYIKKTTGYEHYGYTPIKMATILQLFSRYISSYPNNYHICLTGDMSSGKSAFSKYWGTCLYGNDSWLSNATSISIPKLRGTMETVNFFSKEHRYLYKGLFGDMDLIIIDEIKENEELKQNMKQYALETDYDYSKQSGENNTYQRTSQFIVTQNIDPRHIQRYYKRVKDLYQSDTLKLVGVDEEPKPKWNQNIDLTLHINSYNNPYLRFAIKKVRDEYHQELINWIDGSELALKQRYYFYFYLSSAKSDSQLDKVIKNNSKRKTISSLGDLKNVFDCSNLRKHIENIPDKIIYPTEVNDYFYSKVDKLLEQYDKSMDSRTKDMSIKALDLIRIIDGRDYFSNKDFEILEYFMQNIETKVELADTKKYGLKKDMINKNYNEEVVEEKHSETWDYSDDKELNEY